MRATSLSVLNCNVSPSVNKVIYLFICLFIYGSQLGVAEREEVVWVEKASTSPISSLSSIPNRPAGALLAHQQ